MSSRAPGEAPPDETSSRSAPALRQLLGLLAAFALASLWILGPARSGEFLSDDLPNVLDDRFDLVYTSRGVLGWMPDIRRWAEVVAHFVRPGGRFYITEIHPIANSFENEGVALGELQLVYPYWEHRAPLAFDNIGSYADPDAPVGLACRVYATDEGLQGAPTIDQLRSALAA